MDNKNRLHNCSNPYQGNAKKVLCVCSAGLLRSPTAAWVLSNEPYNYNTRSCGVDIGHALIPIDEVLIKWADELVCMDSKQALILTQMTTKPIKCLNINDCYDRMDIELIRLIKEEYK